MENTKTVRVLHVLHSMNRGGTENALMNYYRHIDRYKVQFDFLLTCSEKSAFEDEIASLGGKIFRVPLPSVFNIIPYLIEVKKFLQNHPEYRIIHSHTSSKSTLPLWVAKKCNVPVRIAHSHANSSESGIQGVIRDILKVPLKLVATDFFACTKDASDWLYGKKYTRMGKVVIMNNVIEGEKFNFNITKRNQIRKNLGISQEDIIVGNIARFNVMKNHTFLVDVFDSMSKMNPNMKLLLVGDGELREDIVSKIKSKGLEKLVFMTGVVENVYDYAQAMDLFLFPSLHEGLGMGLIEAQTSGLTCFTSTNVPKAADITGMVHFLSLKESADYWAAYIMNKLPLERCGHIDDLCNAGYDASNTAIWLQEFYVNKLNAYEKV